MSNLERIRVNTKERDYDIFIGAGIKHPVLAEFIRLSRKLQFVSPAIVVIDKNVRAFCESQVKFFAEHMKVEANIFEFDATEANKKLASVRECYEHFLHAGMSRTTPIVVIGGGITLDTASFAASTFMRGTPYISLPTTLMAMADGCLGGKTGINFDRFKNLIGTFYQPSAVFCEVKFLKTLDPAHIKSGLVEIFKHSLIEGKILFKKFTENIDHILKGDEDLYTELITESLKIKKNIVEEDEREKGVRRILNLGHTFAHAIENETQFKFSHGEAVAAGILISSYFSDKRYGTHNVEIVEPIIKKLGCAEVMKSSFINFKNPKKLIDKFEKYIFADKKKEEGNIHFVFIKNIGEVITEKIEIGDLL